MKKTSKNKNIHIVITRHCINEEGEYYKTADVFWDGDDKRNYREMRFDNYETDDEIERIVEQEIRYGEA